MEGAGGEIIVILIERFLCGVSGRISEEVSKEEESEERVGRYCVLKFSNMEGLGGGSSESESEEDIEIIE